MKHIIHFIFSIFVCTLFVSCTNGKKTLYLFNWTYYTPDSVIKGFEKEFNVKVKIDNFASNEEMFAKLMTGASGYDIIVPSQDYVTILIKLDMLQKIDAQKIPNLHYLSPLVKEKAQYDPNQEYSVPYFMGAAGIAVNTQKVASYEKTWNIFARSDLKNKMTMMDDMREVMGAALSFLGKSVNSLSDEDLKQAKNLIKNTWKPNLVKFDSEGFGKSFASEDFWVVQGFAEVVFGEIPQEEWQSIDFFIPKEGGPMYIDSLCIPKKAKHYDLALQFINYIHRPEVYAQFLDTFHFPSSVHTKAADFMTTKPHYTTEDLINCEIKEDLAEGLTKYDAIWQDIRFTK